MKNQTDYEGLLERIKALENKVNVLWNKRRKPRKRKANNDRCNYSDP